MNSIEKKYISKLPEEIEISNHTSEISENSGEINTMKTKTTIRIRRPITIDIENNKFPYCIVWTPIPFITYIIPFIGHTGICSSNGIIHDFSSSYFVSVNDMAFGNPTKYIILDLNDKEKINWDKAIDKGDERYNMEVHNLFCNNCHSHCAYVLNVVKYKNRSNYNMISIWWMIVTKGKYVNFIGFVKSYIGFFIILILVILIYKNFY